jgi:hypothetical protein
LKAASKLALINTSAQINVAARFVEKKTGGWLQPAASHLLMTNVQLSYTLEIQT